MIGKLLLGGLIALRDYISEHVITCLVPAFLLAGAIVSFVKRELIVAYLGTTSSQIKAFFLSAVSAVFLAACSCTIIPVASGLYFGGASPGSAFIVLWVAPASNLLSLIYTGSVLGSEIVLARIIIAFLMAFIVGCAMNFIFKKDLPQREAVYGQSNPLIQRSGSELIERKGLILILLLLLSLLAPNYLIKGGKYIYKVIVWFVFTIPVVVYSIVSLGKERMKLWLSETWWFVRLIFPLLLVGVFVVGIIGALIPESFVHTWLGGNGLLQSFFATMIGAISYFATLTEAPFVDTLMKLGMGKGPALTLLLTGPGLSLPNWIVVARVFGVKKALIYVPLIIILGTFAGWIYGNLF